MLIILQGRVRSTRLPGKGFFTFFGQTIWERMCDIALAIGGAREVVFATGDLPENHLMRPLVEGRGVRFFAGNEDNVLERFCRVAATSPAEYVVRLTCDNYLIQPEVVEGLVDAVRAGAADYGHVLPLSHFAGEVIRRQTLLDCHASGTYTPQAREHVTWDIRRSTSLRQVALPADFLGLDHGYGLTLDDVDDLIRMKRLEQTCPDLRPVRCLQGLRVATMTDASK